MISWVRWISHIQTHTHTHTCLTVKIFKKPWFHFISRRMCRVQQITSTFSHCKKEVNIFFMDCWVSFAPADLGHGWGNHCTCSFASMKAAQFTNWTDVLVVIGGSDTETRVASSKAESQKFPCWVWICVYRHKYLFVAYVYKCFVAYCVYISIFTYRWLY